jgi:acetoin utilization protein AcuB
MQASGMRHLVVVASDGSIAGMISDRDCKLASVSPFSAVSEAEAHKLLEGIPATRIMSPTPYWVEPLTSVAEAAHIMLTHRISALPVMQDGNLIGIVTSTDLLGTLVAQIS